METFPGNVMKSALRRIVDKTLLSSFYWTHKNAFVNEYYNFAGQVGIDSLSTSL